MIKHQCCGKCLLFTVGDSKNTHNISIVYVRLDEFPLCSRGNNRKTRTIRLLHRNYVDYQSQKVCESRLVSEISTEYLDGPMKLMVPILNKCSVNNVFRVESEDDQVILRINNSQHSLINYQKEAWCMAQAIEHDIPVPRILRIGHFGDYAYIIQSLVKGDFGESLLFGRSFVWHRLGQYVSLIDSIKVEGFGENLTDPRTGRFDDNWIRYINYNITSLTAADPLIRLGIIKFQAPHMKNKNYPIQLDGILTGSAMANHEHKKHRPQSLPEHPKGEDSGLAYSRNLQRTPVPNDKMDIFRGG